LFAKPCFGINKVYLEESNIRSKEDIIKNGHKNVHALNVNTGLIKRKECNLCNFFLQKLNSPFLNNLFNVNKMIPSAAKSTINPLKVYMVPLPDFTVYPEGIDDKREESQWKIFFKILKLSIWPRGHMIYKEEKMSPFLRMIRNDNSAEIYDNPSMAAITDFKWNASRAFFLRHILMYSIFALVFAIGTGGIHKKVRQTIFSYHVLEIAMMCLFFWLGCYLINIERIQLKYNGWKRYFSFYNFFDLFSVILPIIVAVSATIFFKYTRYHINYPKEAEYTATTWYRICVSFSVFVIWIELFLVSLLRLFTAYFQLYIILNY
jgi:hypothetical protein